MQCLSTLGAYREDKKQFEKAIGYYHKGLEVNDLSEEFCQKLMICYQKLGLHAEAFGVYQRLKKTLSSASVVNPSPKKEQILESLNSFY